MIKNPLRAIESTIVRNVGLLVGGTAIAQMIMVMALPLLTRLYSPQDFNLLAAYASVLGLCTVAACMRFNIAIPLPKDERIAFGLLSLSLISGGLLALFVALPVIFIPRALASFLGQPELRPFLWMLPLGVFFAASYDALQYWASRQRRFALVARTRGTRAIGGVGTQLGLGMAGSGPLGLLLGHMLLSGFGSIGLAMSVLRHDRNILRHVKLSKLREAATQYRQFPLYSVPEALFNTAALELSILIVAAVAIGPEAGFLMLAMRVIGLPMSFVGASVAQVWLSEAPRKRDSGELAEFTRQTMLALLKVGAVPMLAVGIVAPFLFPIIFSAEWARSGVILAWLTPMFIAQFIVSPVSSLPHLIGRLKWAMWLQIGICAVRLGAIAAAARFAPSMLVETFAIAGVLCYAFSIVLIHRMARTADVI